MKSIAAILMLGALSLGAQTIPRLTWVVETSDKPVDHRLDLVYGETIELQLKCLSYQKPLDIEGATVTLHCRTNGMALNESFQAAGTASSNGLATVRLTVSDWAPAGLPSVPYTLEVAQTNGVRILRASGTAFLTGTSSTSAAAPIPAFYSTNFLTRIESVSNALSGAIETLRDQIGTGGTGSSGSSTDSAIWRDSANTNLFARLVNGTGTVYQVSRQWAIVVGSTLISYPSTTIATVGVYYVSGAVLPTPTNAVYTAPGLAGTLVISGVSASYFSGLWANYNANYASQSVFLTHALNGTGAAWFNYLARTNALSTFGYTGSASDIAVSNLTAQVGLLQQGVTNLQTRGFSGILSNGNFTASSDPSIDTNAAVSVRSPIEDRIGLYGSAITRPGVEAYSTYAPGIVARSATGTGVLAIQGPVSNSTALTVAGVLVVTNEPTANEGAGESGGISLGGRTIRSWSEIEANVNPADIAALGAWGARLPDGSVNAASNEAVVINSPLLLAAGLAFETSGNYAVWVQSGAEMQVVTNGGWGVIKPSTWPDGIGFRTVSQVIGAQAGSFSVVEGGTTSGYARIRYAYNAGETNAPRVSYSSDLMSWSDAPEQTASQDGTNWTVYVSAATPSAFYRATRDNGFINAIYSAYPHQFDGGIQVSNLAPVVYNSILTITEGGRTYRIPAQEL